jgi:hypothetical protein
MVEDDPLEQRLDQALETTFPASDPVAVSPWGYQRGYPEATGGPTS